MYFDKGLQNLDIDSAYKESIAEFSDMQKYNFNKIDKEELRKKLGYEVKLLCDN